MMLIIRLQAMLVDKSSSTRASKTTHNRRMHVRTPYTLNPSVRVPITTRRLMSQQVGAPWIQKTKLQPCADARGRCI